MSYMLLIGGAKHGVLGVPCERKHGQRVDSLGECRGCSVLQCSHYINTCPCTAGGVVHD